MRLGTTTSSGSNIATHSEGSRHRGVGIDWAHVGEKELARQRQEGTGARLAQARDLLANRPDLLRRLKLAP